MVINCIGVFTCLLNLFCCVNRWDDPYGPVILTIFLILTLSVQFALKVAAMYKGSEGTLNNSPSVENPTH